MKTLNTYINEWKLNDQSVKRVDDNNYFVYSHDSASHIQIFSPYWKRFDDYKDKVYDEYGKQINIDINGYTFEYLSPGEYKFIIKDIDKVNNCSHMFYDCDNLIFSPVFDTSKVVSMRNMFYRCYNLTNAPYLNTKNAYDISGMFLKCKKIEISPKYDTSNTNDVGFMFADCENLKSVPLFTKTNFTRMECMFRKCNKLSEKSIHDWSKIYDFNENDKI